MRTNLQLVMLGMVSIGLSSLASAAEGTWSGSGELGIAVSTGNTDSTIVVGKLGLSKEDEQWKHAIGTSFLFSESNDLESARRYEIFGSSGYRLSERSYLLGSLRNERDRYASDEYQWTAAAGYGYDAIKNDTTLLAFEIGPGYRWSKLQGLREHTNEAILRGAVEFSHKFSERTSIHDALLVEAGSENTFVKNELGLQVKMTDALALKAGLEVRYNTEVLNGADKTDTLTTVNVVYDF